MDDDAIPSFSCPKCGVLLRDGVDGLVCPEDDLTEPFVETTMPAQFEGADIDDFRRRR